MTAARATLVSGTVSLVGAVAGFIVIVPDHAPLSLRSRSQVLSGHDILGPSSAPTWHFESATLYDLAHIATWGLLIVGLIVVAVGLMRYWRALAADGES